MLLQSSLVQLQRTVGQSGRRNQLFFLSLRRAVCGGHGHVLFIQPERSLDVQKYRQEMDAHCQILQEQGDAGSATVTPSPLAQLSQGERTSSHWSAGC